METVIMSLHPVWWNKITTGEKRLEIRKSRPRAVTGPFRVLVYVTGGVGVCGAFICPKVHQITTAPVIQKTIPGLVFIGVLFIWWGNIYPTVIVALSVYAMFPILKNTYTGILEVEGKYVEAAKGCGMSRFQTLVRVELPLAMPTIIAGLRMSAIYTVSWTVLAAMIGKGGLGEFVYQGTTSNNNTLILLGAIPAAILAIVFGAVIDLLQKKVTPRGLRKEAGK